MAHGPAELSRRDVGGEADVANVARRGGADARPAGDCGQSGGTVLGRRMAGSGHPSTVIEWPGWGMSFGERIGGLGHARIRWAQTKGMTCPKRPSTA